MLAGAPRVSIPADHTLVGLKYGEAAPLFTVLRNRNRHSEASWASSLVPVSPLQAGVGAWSLCVWSQKPFLHPLHPCKDAPGPHLHQWGRSTKPGGQAAFCNSKGNRSSKKQPGFPLHGIGSQRGRKGTGFAVYTDNGSGFNSVTCWLGAWASYFSPASPDWKMVLTRAAISWVTKRIKRDTQAIRQLHTADLLGIQEMSAGITIIVVSLLPLISKPFSERRCLAGSWLLIFKSPIAYPLSVIVPDPPGNEPFERVFAFICTATSLSRFPWLHTVQLGYVAPSPLASLPGVSSSSILRPLKRTGIYSRLLSLSAMELVFEPWSPAT